MMESNPIHGLCYVSSVGKTESIIELGAWKCYLLVPSIQNGWNRQFHPLPEVKIHAHSTSDTKVTISRFYVHDLSHSVLAQAHPSLLKFLN